MNSWGRLGVSLEIGHYRVMSGKIYVMSQGQVGDRRFQPGVVESGDPEQPLRVLDQEGLEHLPVVGVQSRATATCLTHPECAMAWNDTTMSTEPAT